MERLEWIGIVISFTGMLLVLRWQIYNINKDNEAKRNRVYARMDEVKKTFEDKMENNYVRKDVCAIQTNQILTALQEVKTDLKDIKDHLIGLK